MASKKYHYTRPPRKLELCRTATGGEHDDIRAARQLTRKRATVTGISFDALPNATDRCHDLDGQCYDVATSQRSSPKYAPFEPRRRS